MGGVGRVEGERSDRERPGVVGQRLPAWTGGHRIGRLPDAAIDGSDINDVRVRRVRRGDPDRSGHGPVGNILDLTYGRRRRALRGPDQRLSGNLGGEYEE